MKNFAVVRVVFVALSAICFCGDAAMPFVMIAKADVPYNYKPEGGYVSRVEVAIPIAEIILKSIYGERVINEEKPLSAKLTADGVWVVRGSFKRTAGTYRVGGVAEIWISKSDGRILRVTHGE